MLKEYIKQILENRINKENIMVAMDYLLENGLVEEYLGWKSSPHGGNVREYIYRTFDLGELGSYKLEVELIRRLDIKLIEKRKNDTYQMELPNGRLHNDKGPARYRKDFVGRPYASMEFFINGRFFFRTTWEEIVES